MGVNISDLLTAAQERVPQITPDGLATSAFSDALLLDVREAHEVALGTLSGSVHIARGLIETEIHQLDPTRPTLVFCAVGERSVLAASTLLDLGFSSVANLAGGFTAWKEAGLDWELPAGFNTDRMARYARHLTLPEIGLRGQERLLDARVALIGAGGLGSPAALYLAAAGVGTLGIFDADRVDVSNLQRQILHGNDRIDQPKTDSARRTIANLNPDVTVQTHAVRVVAANALELLAGYDLIVDGADNFPTRYLLNDVAQHLRIPIVHGSVFRFEGQVTVFDPNDGPCYRCLFPSPPPPELAPNCQEAGILGVLPGVVGTMQATEAIKLIVGIGRPLRGRLLTYDALTQETFQLRIAKSSECPSCGGPPPQIVDYDETCQIPTSKT